MFASEQPWSRLCLLHAVCAIAPASDLSPLLCVFVWLRQPFGVPLSSGFEHWLALHLWLRLHVRFLLGFGLPRPAGMITLDLTSLIVLDRVLLSVASRLSFVFEFGILRFFLLIVFGVSS